MILVSVNMASRQFQRIKIIQEVAQALEQSGLQSQYLMLEITESALMEETEASFASMHELTKMGIRFIMDDFGTGYSSLSYLKRFPLHAIKIDRSFVNDITTDPDDAAITEAIISIAHSLNMKVVAEGVETEEQLAFLRDRGCDEFQGYLLCKPLSIEEISELLAQEKEAEGLYASLMKRHRNQVRT
jgi:EAL domain-containing protein (putative c-di-GMP-specific phosphodiesterase class I)